MSLTRIGTEEVVQFSGASYRQIDYWVRQRYLTPSIDRGLGTGNRRVFGTSDLVKATAMTRLIGIGVQPDVAANVLVDHAVRNECTFTSVDGNVAIHVDVKRIRSQVGRWVESRRLVSA